MSYWISLRGTDGEPVEVDSFTDGGTYALGGSTEADLNVTYNYAAHFDFRALAGRTGRETKAELAKAIRKLGTERDPDYWKPTEGNAGYAISILLRWARQHPNATWEVN